MIQYTYTANSIPFHYTSQINQINQLNQQLPDSNQMNSDQQSMSLENSNTDTMNSFNLNNSLGVSQQQVPSHSQHQQFIFDQLTNDGSTTISDFTGFQNYINGGVVSHMNLNTAPDIQNMEMSIIDKHDSKNKINSRTMVSKCKGTSKHFFKLENKIALLREVCTFNPFEDSSRWKLVSEKYNIWTYNNQPERLYAAVDYLPRKVREMLGNYKQSLKNKTIDQPVKSEQAPGMGNNDDIDNNVQSNRSVSPLDTSKKNPHLNTSESSSEDMENQELNQLLEIVFQMLNNAERNKKNSSKKAKLDSPKSSSEKPNSRKGSFQRKLLSYQANSENNFNSNIYQNNIMSSIDITQSQVQKTQQLQHNTSEPDSLKRKYSSLENNAVGYEELQKILNPLIQKIQILETKVLMLENNNRNLRNMPVNVVQMTQDFQPGINNSLTSLPILQTPLDIERLTAEQLNTYLLYYNLGFVYQSNSEKKKRLAQFLGIVGNDNYSN